MTRFSKVGLALFATLAVLLGGSQAAAASVPDWDNAVPALTAAQAEAIQAQIPPKLLADGKPAIISKAAKPVTSPAPIMSKKGLPKKVGVKALTGCAPDCYYYGVGKQALSPLVGAISLFGVFNPTLGSHGYHSLAEWALQSADEQQTVEVGWTVDNTGVCPTTTQACLFVYSWRNGVGQGYNGGSGWTNYSGRAITVGDSLNSVVNTEKTFGLQYNPPVAPATTGRWWVSYNGGWVGSFAESSWTTGTGAIAAFSYASLAQVFGETVQNVDAPCAMMGNGTTGGTASGGAAPAAGPARINSSSYVSRPNSDVNLAVGATSPDQPVGNVSASHRSFTYGGPQKTTGLCV